VAAAQQLLYFRGLSAIIRADERLNFLPDPLAGSTGQTFGHELLTLLSSSLLPEQQALGVSRALRRADHL
jgi:hypothetical protein